MDYLGNGRSDKVDPRRPRCHHHRFFNEMPVDEWMRRHFHGYHLPQLQYFPPLAIQPMIPMPMAPKAPTGPMDLSLSPVVADGRASTFDVIDGELDKMYDEIFDDFSVIKQHCERNGNIAFDESIVFELLEKYFPKYGSQRSIQKVLDMLDAQRIRESFKNNIRTKAEVPDDSTLEIKNETVDESSIVFHDDSDDADSVVEVEVPKKVFPVIDLTESSHMSDVAVDSILRNIVKDEDSDNNSSSVNSDDNASENYDHDSSDPDITRHVNNDYTTEESRSFDPPLLNFLASLDDPNKSNNDSTEQNPSAMEVPEFLEENNNDPNNNLEGALFEESANVENSVDDTMDASSIKFQTNDWNLNSNNSEELIEDEMIDSIPGCSKDTDRDMRKRINKFKYGLPKVFQARTPSPVAGCSKDFKELHALDSTDESDADFEYDESVLADVAAIQKIAPWAETQRTLQFIQKYLGSENRKQLALWDLTSHRFNQISQNSRNNKRKGEVPNPTSVTPTKKSKNFDYASSVEVVSSNESSNDCMPVSSKQANELVSALEYTNVKKNDKKTVSPLKIRKTTKDASEDSNDTFEVTRLSTTNPAPSSFSSANAQLNSKTTDKSHTTESPNKKPFFLRESPLNSSTLSNNSNNNGNNNNSTTDDHIGEELDLISEIIGIDEIEGELLAGSAKVLLNNPFSKSPSRSQAGGSSTSTIVKPAKFTSLQGSPIISGSQPVAQPPPPVRPAKLNFLNAQDSPEPIRQRTGNGGGNEAQNVPRSRIVWGGSSKIDEPFAHPTWVPRPDDPLGLKELVPNTVRMMPSSAQPAGLRTVSATIVSGQQNSGAGPSAAGPSATVTHANPRATATVTNATANAAVKQPETVTIIKAPTFAPPVRVPGPSFLDGVLQAVAQPSTSGAIAKTETKKVEVPHSVYVKLRSMFPEVKKSYIKSICSNPPILLNTGDPQYVTNVLVDHLLREGSNHLEVQQMQPYVPEEPASALSVDEKYEYLVGIFPNADPTYLREFVEKETTTEQAIEDFIQQKLENHDYPTKEDYLKKIKATEQIRQYTVNFNVENFLELFPDPVKHFEDEKRQAGYYEIIAMEFLKSHFNRHKVCTLNKAYRMNKYNLSLTAKALSEMPSDMKSKRGNTEMPTENIPLLQEITYVKNKKKILDHIKMKKAQEEETFKDLKEKGLLLTCLCCYNDECMPAKSSECNSGHVFCYECIIRGTEAALSDGNTHVRCFTDCQSEFSLATLQKILSPTNFSALLKKRQAAEVMAAGVDGLVSCPFCYFASIPPPEDKVFKCLNPECMKESCRLCKELNHVPLRCDEVIKTDKARLMIEEKMTEALLRTCYQCKKQFYKEEGCNKMRCPCGAIMCYVCDKPVKGYDHFNAQGGANSNLCPLWSDDRRLNAEAVRQVAEEVKNTILKQNPNLKIDTESLLPKLPPKSRGPHDDIPNANQIPEHVRRVAHAAP